MNSDSPLLNNPEISSNRDHPSEDESSPLLPRETTSISPSRKRIYYSCFLFLGLATLLPWNFFITADSYWQYKFRNVTTNGTTQLQLLYTPVLVCLSQITNFSLLFFNALFSHMISDKKRVYVSLSFMIFFFSATSIMTNLQSDDWQLAFFIVTMFIIAGISASGAVFQGALLGVAGMFPETYMCAVTGGMSLGGVFASLARIFSLSTRCSPVTSALIYFLIAVLVMLLTLFVYVYLSSTTFFKECYLAKRATQQNIPSRSFLNFMKDHFKIFKRIWPLCVSTCFVLLVTLSIFPVVADRVKSSYDNEFAHVYFQPVFTFLLFNMGDYLGRQIAGYTLWPRRGSNLIYIFTLLRVIFIPLFLMCNHDPSSSIPSVFKHDAWYVGFMSLFSFTNGYLFSLCMMYAPRMVPEELAEKAGTMMAAVIGFGLLLGSGISFIFAAILS